MSGRRAQVVRAQIVGAMTLAGLFGLALGSSAVAAPRQTPSGLPVPRYVTLKFATVNARSGPGDDQRMLWVYHARGLPVQVVAETAEWRRVCDPEGSLSWVHKRTTDGRRSVMNLKPAPVALRKHPKPDAGIGAYLNPRAVATLLKCDKGWCRVRADGVAGWAPDGELWGTVDAPQCR